MKTNQLIFNITSEDRDRLGAFYRDVVGLEKNEEAGEYAFNVGGAMFIIDGHSETKGRAVEPHRYLFNFMVDDIQAEQDRLEAQGVTFIRKMGREYWGGVFSTFLDPDGNYAQLMAYQPEAAAGSQEATS
jgi:predicted enzyme related to lactoylglutathione lyase